MTAPDQDARDRIVAARGVNLVVEAGAGTGKTTLLVERVTALVRDGTRLSRLAVITFTRKAAAELEARLVRRLAEARAAGAAWAAAALDDLPHADIGTTDSFCRSILADFALEAGLPAGFALADEIAAEALRDVAWARFLSRATEADARLYTELRELGVKRSTLRDVADAFVEQRDLRTPVAARVDLPPLVDVFAEALAGALALRDRCAEPTDRLRQRIDDLERDLAIARGVGRFAAERTLLSRTAYATRLGQQEAWGGADVKAEAIAALSRLGERVAEWRSARSAVRAADVAAWLARYSAEYERLKRERGLVDFRDLALATRNLLRDRPEARRRIAARWDAILLDEAQDTDPLQMEIALLLAAGESARGDPFGAALAPGRLFLVGDPKQSIYRFRRADLELYTRTRGVVHANGESATIQANFRSHPSILRFVNRIFEGWMEADEATPWQAPYVPLLAGRARAGDGTDDARRVVLLRPDGGVRGDLLRRSGRATLVADERADLEIDAVVRAVRRVLGRDGAGRPWRVVDPGRGLERDARAADVGVLTRQTAWGDRLLDALRRAGIPATSTAGRGFHAREEIMTLSILLQAVIDPDDRRALFAALRSPALAVTDDDLVRHFLGASGEEPDTTSPPAVDAEARLRALSEAARTLPPAEFLERLAEELALLPAFGFRPDGAARVENLRLVIEAAAPLAEAGFDSLPDFARWLAERRPDDALALGEIEPPGGDVVSILTIHKAKGLEFPVVVLADLGGKSRPPPPFVADRGLGTLEFRMSANVETAGYADASRREKLRRNAEELRLLYVAATRARDWLVVSWPEGEHGFLEKALLPTRLGVAPGQPPPTDSDLVDLPADTLPPRGAAASVHVVDVEAAIRAGHAAVGTGELFEAPSPAPVARRAGRIVPVTALADVDVAGVPPGPFAPSRDAEDPLSGKAFGTFVHAALEAWDPRAPFEDALTRAAEVGLLRVGLPGAHAARDRLVGELRRIATDPAVREVLEATRAADRPARREVPFLVPLGRDFLSGTVDVILERLDGTLSILDYKTERLGAGGAAAARHRDQAALYAWAVSRLARREVADVRLVFLSTHPATVTTFPGADLEGAARAILADADRLRRVLAREAAGPPAASVRDAAAPPLSWNSTHSI